MATDGSATGTRNCWSTILFKMAMSDVDAGDSPNWMKSAPRRGRKKNLPESPMAFHKPYPTSSHRVCTTYAHRGMNKGNARTLRPAPLVFVCVNRPVRPEALRAKSRGRKRVIRKP